ncbi:MAG: hypothetical protein NC035_09315 [Bacteroides sp.]|nr:hypothetical protein [Bacteroides sp.]
METSKSKLEALKRIANENLSDPLQQNDRDHYDLIARQDAFEKIEIEKQKLKLAGEKQDQDQRKTFADKIFMLISIYLLCVFFIVLLEGVTLIHFHLDSEIIITILGTTTANVLMLFYFVPKYLFSDKRK